MKLAIGKGGGFMDENMMVFLFWAAFGVIFVGYGLYVCFSNKEKPFGFWANAEQFPVNDVTGYNHALGILFIIFGIVFVLLGLPLLGGQNSAWIILSVLGCMAEAIFAMAIYVTVIEKKYKAK